jgi:hypothetical protein
MPSGILMRRRLQLASGSEKRGRLKTFYCRLLGGRASSLRLPMKALEIGRPRRMKPSISVLATTVFFAIPIASSSAQQAAATGQCLIHDHAYSNGFAFCAFPRNLLTCTDGKWVNAGAQDSCGSAPVWQPEAERRKSEPANATK